MGGRGSEVEMRIRMAVLEGGKGREKRQLRYGGCRGDRSGSRGQPEGQEGDRDRDRDGRKAEMSYRLQKMVSQVVLVAEGADIQA